MDNQIFVIAIVYSFHGLCFAPLERFHMPYHMQLAAMLSSFRRLFVLTTDCLWRGHKQIEPLCLGGVENKIFGRVLFDKFCQYFALKFHKIFAC